MSYQTIKTYFSRRLATFNLREAKKKVNLDNESENFDNIFIIENPKTDLDNGDTLATRFFPKREFVIKTWHKASETGIVFEYDTLQTRLENVLRDLHSKSNYSSDSIRAIWFNTLSVSVEKGYIASQMTFIVEDSLDYVA